MLLGALGLAGLAVLLAWPAPRLLAHAGWPRDAPVAALLLWQAVGLAGGLAAIGAGLLVAVEPLGPSLPQGLTRLAGDVLAGHPGRNLQPASWVALALSVGLALRLLLVLVSQTVRTLRLRHRHRTVVDLVADPWPEMLPDMLSARVLAHSGQVAYCLPGRQARVVLSRGTVERLSGERLAAVLAHEGAHLRQRHDLVVLPFVALRATFPFLPGVRLAQDSVAELVEMMADDAAVRRCGPAAVCGALTELGGATSPAAGLLPGDTVALDHRLARMRCGNRDDRILSTVVAGTAVALVAVPTLALVLPALLS